MSWLSSFVRNVTGNAKPDPPDPALQRAIEEQTRATREAQEAAKASADAALKAQKDAGLIALASSLPTADSESARAAADAKRRKLLGGSSFGIGLPNTFGEAPTGFRVLSGQ